MQNKPIQQPFKETSPPDWSGEWLRLAHAGLAQHGSLGEPETLQRLARTLQRLGPAAQALLDSSAPPAIDGDWLATARSDFAQTLVSLAVSPA
jgi:hypothetical protein